MRMVIVTFMKIFRLDLTRFLVPGYCSASNFRSCHEQSQHQWAMFKSTENQKPLGEYCRSSPGWLDLLHWRMACDVFPQCRLQCPVLLRIHSWNLRPRAGVERLHIAQHNHDGDKHNNRNSNDDIGDNDNDNNDHRNDHHDHHNNDHHNNDNNNNDNNNGNLATGARLKIVGFQWHFRVECINDLFLRQDKSLPDNFIKEVSFCSQFKTLSSGTLMHS